MRFKGIEGEMRFKGIWSLKDPAHHIPNQTEIATEEFCPKSLLRKQNEIDFIESHFQILHHLKIVHLSSTEVR